MKIIEILSGFFLTAAFVFSPVPTTLAAHKEKHAMSAAAEQKNLYLSGSFVSITEPTIIVIKNNHQPQIERADEFPEPMQKMSKPIYLFAKKIGERAVPVCKITINQYDANGKLTDDEDPALRIHVTYFDCDDNILYSQHMVSSKNSSH